jgi:hypothetical protein
MEGSRSLVSLGWSGRRGGRNGGLFCLWRRAPVSKEFGYHYADDLRYRDGQQRARDAEKLPAYKQCDQDNQPVEMNGSAVDDRLQ